MQKSRRLFFQILLLILAALFVFIIKYITETESVTAGAFGQGGSGNTVTISQAVAELTERGAK